MNERILSSDKPIRDWKKNFFVCIAERNGSFICPHCQKKWRIRKQKVELKDGFARLRRCGYCLKPFLFLGKPYTKEQIQELKEQAKIQAGEK